MGRLERLERIELFAVLSADGEMDGAFFWHRQRSKRMGSFYWERIKGYVAFIAWH